MLLEISQEETLRWRASRARGHTWWPTVIETMCSIHDPETVKRLHISLNRGSGPNVGRPNVEVDILTQYAKLCMEICSARCWSQCQYCICIPNAFASVHHSDTGEREKGLKLVQKVWNAVLQAEETLKDDRLDAGVRDALEQIMAHMSWHKSQVARELFLVCEAGGWRFSDQQIRQLGFYLFSPPANSKHFLEDTFAHLADISKRIGRNLKISKKLN